jgi:hypothetical protein
MMTHEEVMQKQKRVEEILNQLSVNMSMTPNITNKGIPEDRFTIASINIVSIFNPFEMPISPHCCCNTDLICPLHNQGL